MRPLSDKPQYGDIGVNINYAVEEHRPVVMHIQPSDDRRYVHTIIILDQGAGAKNRPTGTVMNYGGAVEWSTDD